MSQFVAFPMSASDVASVASLRRSPVAKTAVSGVVVKQGKAIVGHATAFNAEPVVKGGKGLARHVKEAIATYTSKLAALKALPAPTSKPAHITPPPADLKPSQLVKNVSVPVRVAPNTFDKNAENALLLKTSATLKAMCDDAGYKGYSSLAKAGLVYMLLTGGQKPPMVLKPVKDGTRADLIAKCKARIESGDDSVKGYSGLKKDEIAYLLEHGAKPKAEKGSARDVKAVTSQAFKDAGIKGFSKMTVKECKEVAKKVEAGKPVTAADIPVKVPNFNTGDWCRMMLKTHNVAKRSTHKTVAALKNAWAEHCTLNGLDYVTGNKSGK